MRDLIGLMLGLQLRIERVTDEGSDYYDGAQDHRSCTSGFISVSMMSAAIRNSKPSKR